MSLRLWSGRTTAMLTQAVSWCVLAGFAVAVLIPLVWSLSGALHSNANLYTAPFQWLPSPLHWKNYPSAWNGISFGTDMLNSAIVGLAISAGSIVLGLMAAYGFTKFEFPGRRLLFGSIVGTILLPFPAIMVPLFSLTRSVGLVDSYLGLIIPGLVSAQGLFLMRQYLLGLPDELLESARIDGASERRIFLQIVFPLCWPVVAAVGLLTFVASWNNLLWPLIVINSQGLYTVPLGLQQFNTQFFTDYVSMLAMSVVAMLPVIAIFLASRKRLLDSVMASGGATIG